MFEIAGVSEEVAREALRLASHKLPIKTKIVKREELEAQEAVSYTHLDVYKRQHFGSSSVFRCPVLPAVL